MTSNPYASDSRLASSNPTGVAVKQSGIWRSTSRSAITGAKIAAFIGGAISLLLIIPSFALAAFGLGSGGGWALPKFFFTGLASFLYIVGCGTIISAALGFAAALLRIAFRQRAVRSDREANEDLAQPSALSERDAGPAQGRRWKVAIPRWVWAASAGIIVVVLIASVVGFAYGAALRRAVDERSAAAIAAADRDEPNWRLDDLLASREEVADEDNSAIMVDEVLANLPNRFLGSTAPHPGEEGTRAGQLKSDFRRLDATASNMRLSGATADSLRLELKDDVKAIELARSLAGYRRGRHELEIGPTIMDTPLQQTQDVREVARLLMIDVAVRAHDGDVDGALDSCRAIMASGRSIGDEPFIMSELVRIAVGRLAMQSMQRAIAQGEPSDLALARAQESIALEANEPILLTAMRGERAAHFELIRRVGAGELPIAALSGSETPGQVYPNPADSGATALWFDYQMTLWLEWVNDAIAIAKSPPAEQPGLWQTWQANVDRVKASRFVKFTAIFPILLSPSIRAAGRAFSGYQCELGTMVNLIAAERHRHKHGAWPNSVKAIDPHILPSPPVDPYSGQPFRMNHRDGKLVIYSIGPNGKDEHGQYDPKRSLEGDSDDMAATAWDVSLRAKLHLTEENKPD